MSLGTRIAESTIVELNGCYPSRIVMHDRGGYERYAVHTEVLPPASAPYFVSGFYTNDLVDAVRDFGDRGLRDVRAYARQQEAMAS